jgi:hypothetical protein
MRTSVEKGVSQAPEYVIISEELPKEFSEEPGFTTEFIVDYVKIYQNRRRWDNKNLQIYHKPKGFFI